MSRGVLIVDDDQFIRKLITTTLEDVTDFDLHEAADGLQALEIARRERPTIVFLDVDMPELDGIEACRRLRADETTGDATTRGATPPPPQRTRPGARATRLYGLCPTFADRRKVRPAGSAPPPRR